MPRQRSTIWKGGSPLLRVTGNSFQHPTALTINPVPLRFDVASRRLGLDFFYILLDDGINLTHSAGRGEKAVCAHAECHPLWYQQDHKLRVRELPDS